MSCYHELKRRYIQSIVLCMLPVVLTAGCIAIPLPVVHEKPYEEETPNLHVGFTLKHDVIAQFGDPDATYFQNSEFVYTVLGESWKIFWVVYDAGVGVQTLHKRHVLLLSFDTKGYLSNVLVEKAGDDFGDCTKSGICFGEGNEVMRYADATAEAHAKDFPALENQCSVYLHGPGKKKVYVVKLNDMRANYPRSVYTYNMFSRKSFIHWTLNPGQYSITISPRHAYLQLNCQAGETNFVHFKHHRFRSSTIQFEDQVTGREHIASRRLILLPSRPE